MERNNREGSTAPISNFGRGLGAFREDILLSPVNGVNIRMMRQSWPLSTRLSPSVMGTMRALLGITQIPQIILFFPLVSSFLPSPIFVLFFLFTLPKSLFTTALYQSLAMFAASLSLGLALLPFVSAAIIDIQVGAAGKLTYSPEAIVKVPIKFLFQSSYLFYFYRVLKLVIRWSSTSSPRTTLSPSLLLLTLAERKMAV